MSSIKEANDERHYLLIVVAVVIGIVGVYFRFAHFHYASPIANIILIIGIIVALKAVFDILK